MLMWAVALIFTVTIRSSIKCRHWSGLLDHTDTVSRVLVKCGPEWQEVDAERRCVRKMCLCNSLCSCTWTEAKSRHFLKSMQTCATFDNKLVSKNNFLTECFCCLKSNIYSLKKTTKHLFSKVVNWLNIVHCWTMSRFVSVFFVKHHVRY